MCGPVLVCMLVRGGVLECVEKDEECKRLSNCGRVGGSGDMGLE